MNDYLKMSRQDVSYFKAWALFHLESHAELFHSTLKEGEKQFTKSLYEGCIIPEYCNGLIQLFIAKEIGLMLPTLPEKYIEHIKPQLMKRFEMYIDESIRCEVIKRNNREEEEEPADEK